MKKKQPDFTIQKQQQQSISAKSTADNKATLIPTEWLNKNGIYLVSALLSITLILLLGQYIFGERLFIFKDIGSDTINQYYPSFYQFSQYIHNIGVPKWSFHQGLGQNLFPAFLGDFATLSMYFFNPENIHNAFIYPQLIKIFLGGLFFFLFLKKIKLSSYTAILGAMLYAFCGFMLIGSTWYIFTAEGLYLALLLYGFELLRKDNNLLVFPVAVAALASYNPIYLYLDGLLLTAYLIATISYEGLDIKKERKFLGKIIALGILGVGMGALLMLGNLNQMIESPRGSGGVSYSHLLSSKKMFFTEESIFYKTFLVRLFSNDMAGYADSFLGWQNYLEAPMQYSGLISLLLLPQLFFAANKRLKALALLAVAAASLAVVFPYFRYTFWLYTGDYFRTFSLFLSVLQILLALIALDKIIKTKRIQLAVLLLTLVGLLVVVFSISIVNPSLKWPVIFLLLAETALLWMIAQQRFQQIAGIVLPILVIIEIVVLSNGTFNKRDTLKSDDMNYRIGYNDYTKDAVKLIQANDKSFYRIDKDFTSAQCRYGSHNDAAIQGYYGSHAYTSFNQKYHVNFLQKMKVIADSNEIATRWLFGLRDRPLLMELTSHKYLLLKNSTQGLVGLGYDSIANINGIKVFKNNHSLPLGFTYNTLIESNEIQRLSIFQRDIMILKAAVVQPASEKIYSDNNYQKSISNFNYKTVADTISNFSFAAYDSMISALKRDTLQITSFEQNEIKGTIDNAEKKLLFFSIPFDKGWKAVIDGQEQENLLVNYGFLGYSLEKGKHTVELSYHAPYYNVGIGVSAFSLLLYAGLSWFYFKRRKETL